MKTRFFEVVSFVLAMAIVLCALVTGALSEGNYLQYAEAQLGYTIPDQLFIFAEPNEGSAKVAKLNRGDKVAILGKTNDGAYLVVKNDQTTGYIKVGNLAMNPQYVTILNGGSAKAGPSMGAYNAFDIAAGDELVVLEVIMIGSDEVWYSVLDKDHGLGMVNAISVSQPYMKPEDEALLAQFRSTAVVVQPATAEEEQLVEEEILDDEMPETTSNETTQVVGGGNFEKGENATVLCDTKVYDTDKTTEKDSIKAGTTVYVYQKGDTYSWVIYNNQNGYVLNDHLGK